ncbi:MULTISPECIES: hypothetical protein [Cyanophyceae]|uniref:Late embryogenesis abundant protein n=1 Tax=Leptolyngbya subtilissima DQ-A4 TaxID=2933933 RepID=A0ABV0KAT8_9CYAN|nr:hypothetical protein [Nodosilinea sp. FACHB-141]MBD2111824.1 hypothetical protein [Nodosilinea sp. FACHB-141]
MQTLKRIFNPNALRQWIVVFLAGLVVLTTTACGTAQAALPTGNSSGSNNPATADSEGMYPHKDTDMDTSGADAKADRMIRQAEQRIQENIDRPIPQRYGDAAKDVGQSAKETAQDVGQSAKEAVKNIGKSTQRAADNAAENARGVVNGSQPNS